MAARSEEELRYDPKTFISITNIFNDRMLWHDHIRDYLNPQKPCRCDSPSICFYCFETKHAKTCLHPFFTCTNCLGCCVLKFYEKRNTFQTLMRDFEIQTLKCQNHNHNGNDISKYLKFDPKKGIFSFKLSHLEHVKNVVLLRKIVHPKRLDRIEFLETYNGTTKINPELMGVGPFSFKQRFCEYVPYTFDTRPDFYECYSDGWIESLKN